jgi:hypothetical protein
MEHTAEYAFWLACIYPPFGSMVVREPERAMQMMDLKLSEAEKRKFKEILEADYTLSGSHLIEGINGLVAQKLGPPPPPPPPWRNIMLLGKLGR